MQVLSKTTLIIACNYNININTCFNIISNYKLLLIIRNDQTDTDTVLCIDDSDTISNQSAENIEREQQDFDQRWAMSMRMDNGEITTNCETFNPLDEVNYLSKD